MITTPWTRLLCLNMFFLLLLEKLHRPQWRQSSSSYIVLCSTLASIMSFFVFTYQSYINVMHKIFYVRFLTSESVSS